MRTARRSTARATAPCSAAAEKGIADPQKAPACLKCHVTAYGTAPELIKMGFEFSDGVQCESCHGPAGQHMKARFAVAANASPGTYVTLPEGEIIADPKEATCRGCHNKESPTCKEFCFHEYRAKVSHLNPKKPRTRAKKDAILACGCGDSCGCVEKCADGCGVPSSSAKDQK